MGTDERLLRLRDDAGVHDDCVGDIHEIAEILHSWYISPDHPDVAEDPDLRETITHAHDAIDALVELYLRGQRVGELAAWLDVTIAPAGRGAKRSLDVLRRRRDRDASDASDAWVAEPEKEHAVA